MFSTLSRGCSQVLLIVLLCASFVPTTKLTAAGHGSQPARAGGDASSLHDRHEGAQQGEILKGAHAERS